MDIEVGLRPADNVHLAAVANMANVIGGIGYRLRVKLGVGELKSQRVDPDRVGVAHVGEERNEVSAKVLTAAPTCTRDEQQWRRLHLGEGGRDVDLRPQLGFGLLVESIF